MDGVSLTMTGPEIEQLAARNRSFNLALTSRREASTDLGKDEFLKILITQLTNQDPTEPMSDRDFIAQMAQFSTLEQMTNMSAQFAKLGGMIQSGQAFSLLGKHVDVITGGSVVSGQVSEVTGGDFPQVLVNGRYYDYANVERVRERQE